ncbi:MAG: hypothetical protein AAFQ61_07930 [Cyanobacteria bacterium J06626_23]
MSYDPRHIPDHESLPLNTPNAAWQVQSGSVALCRMALGQPQCFFTVNPGEIIFGVEADDTDLVALALEPTVVVPV